MRLRRSIVVLGLLFAVLAVAGIGVFRVVSASAVDRRVAIVRPVLDISPEFREQAFVYDVYPRLREPLGSREVFAVSSSVVPGRFLRLVGVEKDRIYTDVSRDYSETMNQLGYYRTRSPLRVGIAGELWAGFGLPGFIVGLVLFGALLGALASSAPPPDRPIRLVATAVLGSLLVLALITPLPAILPLSLMTLLPFGVLWALRR